MVAIIREADRDPVAAVAKRYGASEQTIYTWRKRFGGLQASDVKRLRQLELIAELIGHRPTKVTWLGSPGDIMFKRRSGGCDGSRGANGRQGG